MDDKNEVKPIIGNLSSRLSSGSRLPSFKAPRDLSLLNSSAALNVKPLIARTKKQFVPNIFIKREKTEKLPESKSEKSLKRPPFKGKQQGRGKFIKKEKEFIQTKGSLFGEGVAATAMKRPNYHGGYASGSKDKDFIQKPVFKHDEAQNVDKDLEEKRLMEILRDDFIDDPDDNDTSVLSPIKLPMVVTSKVIKEDTQKDMKRVESISQILGSVRIKEEPIEDEGTENLKRNLENIKLQDEMQSLNSNDAQDFQILTDVGNGVMFFQMPHCLPGHPPEVKQEAGPQNPSQKMPSFSGSETNTSNYKNMCTFSTLPEGRVGTLKIYESGKTELWLGEHKLSLHKGTPVGFLQDVVSISTDKEAKTGSMCVLGHIKQSIVCTPDYDLLSMHKLMNT